MSIKEMLADFVDLVFPRCCECCDRPLVGNENMICTICLITLPRLEADSIISKGLQYRFVSLSQVISTSSFLMFTKKGKVQRLLHALKYKGNTEIGILLGQLFGTEMMKDGKLPKADLIVSVPLHLKKRKSRGYNQSDLLAEGFSLATGIPWTGKALERVRYTETQTGKSKSERRKNVENVFRIGESISAKRIIIIDDVLTTGATLEECVKTLSAGGCEEFHILTIALAQH